MRFLERHLWVSLAMLAGLLVLLVALIAHQGGRLPVLKPFQPAGEAPLEWLGGDESQRWFSPEISVRLAATSNTINPFFTRHFQPPPPPPTRPVALLYQGLMTSSDNTRLAYVVVEDQLRILTNGARVVADHGIQSIALRQLVLTNAAGTNVLHFNLKTNLQVPAN